MISGRVLGFFGRNAYLSPSMADVFVSLQQLSWMIKVGGWIILVVGVTKAKLF
jgi:hypothetical protein